MFELFSGKNNSTTTKNTNTKLYAVIILYIQLLNYTGNSWTQGEVQRIDLQHPIKEKHC